MACSPVVADLWSWLGDVVGRIGDLSIYWLLLALALKTAESAFIGLGWIGYEMIRMPADKEALSA